MPLRSLPQIGARVEVSFLALRVRGTIEDMSDEGRTLMVLTDDGEMLAFRLDSLSGRFRSVVAGQAGPRLAFLPVDTAW